MVPARLPQSTGKPLAWLWRLALVIFVTGGVLWLYHALSPKPVAVHDGGETGPAAPTGEAKRDDGFKREAAPDPPDGWEKVLREIQEAAERIEALVAKLSPTRRSADDLAILEEIRQLLAVLAESLRAMPNDLAAAAMLAYLDSGKDSATGLLFRVGEGGLLEDSPTLRTFLLDLLADIDASGALDHSLGLLNTSNSAGEWALALRNIAWQDVDGSYRDLLGGRLSELLDQQTWLAQPDEGFLEAFDLAVHLADAGALREMGSVLGLRDATGKLADNGITHAAFLALDRITAADPGQTVELIRADQEFLSWAPRHRGALMSRADIRDPDQAAAVGEYLRRGDLSEEERFAFLELFPNPNGVLADALISSPATPLEFSSAVARDQAALQLVRGWLADPRYSGGRPELLAAEGRLAGFVQAGTAQSSGN